MGTSFKNAKTKVEQILAQAKESVKVLEALQQEGMNRVRAMLDVPAKNAAQKLANEKLVSSLKKVGLATRSEVRELEKRVEELASELRTQINQISKAQRKSTKSHSKSNERPTDTNA